MPWSLARPGLEDQAIQIWLPCQIQPSSVPCAALVCQSRAFLQILLLMRWLRLASPGMDSRRNI